MTASAAEYFDFIKMLLRLYYTIKLYPMHHFLAHRVLCLQSVLIISILYPAQGGGCQVDTPHKKDQTKGDGPGLKHHPALGKTDEALGEFPG